MTTHPRQPTRFLGHRAVIKCLVASACIAWVCNALAADDIGKQVAELVEQLDAGRNQARQSAEDQLIALGIEAIDHLPAMDGNTPREVRMRLTRIRKLLETQAAAEASQSSLVTLDGSYELAEALEAIHAQTGNRIVDYRQRFGQPADKIEVHLSLDNSPFWVAIQQLMERADLSIYPYSGEPRAISLISSDPSAIRATAYWSSDQAFRFAAVRAVAQRDFRDVRQTSLRLAVEVMWEPRLTPIVLRVPLGRIQATDDQGRPILVTAESEVLETPVQSTVPTVVLNIPVELPRRDVHMIRQLQGEISAIVPGRHTTFEFGELDKSHDMSKTQGAVTVTVVATGANGPVLEVRILVEYDRAFDALDSHRAWIYENEVFLRSEEKERTEHSGYEVYQRGENQVGLSYKFVALEDLEGQTLVYRTPATLSVQRLRFDLKDIPLP